MDPDIEEMRRELEAIAARTRAIRKELGLDEETQSAVDTDDISCRLPVEAMLKHMESWSGVKWTLTPACNHVPLGESGICESCRKERGL